MVVIPLVFTSISQLCSGLCFLLTFRDCLILFVFLLVVKLLLLFCLSIFGIPSSCAMSSFEQLVSQATELGLTGAEVGHYVLQQQTLEREKQASERENGKSRKNGRNVSS